MKGRWLSIGFLLGCGILGACGSDDTDGGGGAGTQGGNGSTCAKMCDKTLAAKCAGDAKDACVSTCEADAAKVPVSCKQVYDGLSACVVLQGTFVCNDKGKGVLQESSCSLQQASLVTCLTSGAGGASGAGGQGGASGAAGSSGKGGAGGSSGGAGGASAGGAGTAGSAGGGPVETDITTSAECKAWCNKKKAECDKDCIPAMDCKITTCAAADKAYLKCEADTGDWYCGTDGYSIMSDCERDDSLCK